MNVKENVLRFLEKHKDQYVSGEEIAESLGVTRSSVWKAISAFRDEGYEIEAATRRGYRLKSDSNMITKAGIGSAYLSLDPIPAFVIMLLSDLSLYPLRVAASIS